MCIKLPEYGQKVTRLELPSSLLYFSLVQQLLNPSLHIIFHLVLTIIIANIRYYRVDFLAAMGPAVVIIPSIIRVFVGVRRVRALVVVSRRRRVSRYHDLWLGMAPPWRRRGRRAVMIHLVQTRRVETFLTLRWNLHGVN